MMARLCRAGRDIFTRALRANSFLHAFICFPVKIGRLQLYRVIFGLKNHEQDDEDSFVDIM